MDEDKVLAAIAALGGDLRAEMRNELSELRGALMARFERVEDRLTSMAEDIRSR